MRSRPSTARSGPAIPEAGAAYHLVIRLGAWVLLSVLAAAPAWGDDDRVQDDLSKSNSKEMKEFGRLGPFEDPTSLRTPELYDPPASPEGRAVPAQVAAKIDSAASAADSTAFRTKEEPKDEETESEDAKSKSAGRGSPFDRLELFGIEVFAQGAAGFQTFDEVPVPADYQLGPGDMLVVNVWGRVDKTYELIVDREGKVFLPEAGAVVVWGLNLDKATARIHAQLATVYSGFKVNVMMGRVRSIRVYVYGEARQTGSYTVSSLSTLMNVLHQAGGPTDRGSLRGVRILRDGRLHRTVDLYQVLLRGEAFEPDLNLSSNDAIFIPVAGPRVWVAGEVNRPAIYELAGGETIADVVGLAGGPTPDAYTRRVNVDRLAAGERRLVLDLDLADPVESATSAQDGDRVLLFRADEAREDVVVLKGWVKHPGVYGHHHGLRVSDLLRHGEALRPESYLPRAVIRRPLPDGNVRVIAVDLSVALGVDLRRGARPEGESFLAGREEHLGAPVTNEPPSYGTPSPADPDPVLEPRDVLEIYSARDVGWRHYVTIDGEIGTPGRYLLARDMHISDLVFEAGGLTPKADLVNAELVRLAAAGESEVFRINLDRVLVQCDPAADMKLEKDDALLVRGIADRLEAEKVEIEGEVRFPGRYSLTRRDEPLSAVLERAGGVTEHAFLDGAVFTRESITEDIERQNVVPVFMSFHGDSAADLQGQPASEHERTEPELLPNQRMTIDLERLLETGNRRYDVPLRDGDALLIPRRPTGIPVVGRVAAAGSVKYKSGEDVGFYVDRVGGVTPDGDKGGIRVVRADGEVEKVGRGGEVRAGDAIVVPPKQGRPFSWRWLRNGIGVAAGAAVTVVVANLLR